MMRTSPFANRIGHPGFHPLDDVFERDYQVKTLVDLDGQLVAQALHLDEDDILDEECFEDFDAEEEYEGCMGNSGPTATHWHRVTVRLSTTNFDDRAGFLSETVAPIFNQRHDAVAFRLGFLSDLFHRTWEDLIPSEGFQKL
ncbi:hypothetical protein ACJZ2D_009329 [Fusarium nematophilum]